VFGAKALGIELGRRLGREPQIAGAGGKPRVGGWEDDLAAARDCLRTAGNQVSVALANGGFPIVLAGDCTISLGTMPVLARERPSARLLWLDAHGDFNLPDTTPSGFLGGMCLAGATGAWDAGADPVFPASGVVLAGARDLDPGEQEALESSEVRVLPGADPDEVASALAGAPAYVHLDVDVLDPEIFPAAEFPAPGGLSEADLEEVLEAAADATEIVGLEVTAFHAPDDPGERAELARLAADALAPLLARLA
jgi:arginase family enzyme